MNRLFIQLYLDEDVDVLVADLVKARGFSALTTREAGQLSNTDAEQFACAVDRKMALLTHNRVHFEALNQQYFSTPYNRSYSSGSTSGAFASTDNSFSLLPRLARSAR